MDEKIVEEIATKVMGWRIVDSWAEWERTPDQGYVLRTKAVTSTILIREGNIWNPLRNPADCKMVREKLAERFKTSALCRNVDQSMTFSVSRHGAATSYYAEADTEERAVCLCALKTVE